MTKHLNAANAAVGRGLCPAQMATPPRRIPAMPPLVLRWIELFDGVQRRYEPVVGSRP